MGTKLTFALGLTVGFLAGSKAGPRYYDAFVAGLRRLRRTRVVSRPIEAAADQASQYVRNVGEELTDRAASSIHRKIAGAGQGPLVVEARITEVEGGVERRGNRERA